MDELVEHLVGPLLGYFLASLVRYLKRYRFWRKVEVSAKAALEDSRVPITSPREAAEHALIEAQREPVERVARAVRESIPPPTSGRPDAPAPRAGSVSDLDRDPGKSG